MAVSVPKLSFAAGEISPMVLGRTDLQWLASAAKLSRNFIASPWGPPVFSPGLRFVAKAKTAGKRCRLVDFVFSVTQAYVIEFGDTTLRFFIDQAQIETSPGNPYELTGTPWAEANLPNLRWTQSADVLYVVDGAHQQQKLSRTAHTNWSRDPVVLTDGPYYAINATATTLDPAANTGTNINVIASAVTGINNGQGFLSTDVGRLGRWQDNGGGNTWGIFRIVAVNTTTSIQVDWLGSKTDPPTASPTGFTGHAPSVKWRLGLYSDTTGWPFALAIHQGRMGYASAPKWTLPRVDLSASADFDNFQPGTQDDDAIALVLVTGDVSILYNLESLRDLIALGAGKETKIGTDSLTEPLAPTNASAKPVTSHGSSNVKSELAGNSIIMVQRDGRTLRQFTYAIEADGYLAKSLMWRAEHIFKRQMKASGNRVREIAWQQEPWSTVWACDDPNGWLYGLTFAPEQEVYAWHPHPRARTKAAALVVESIATIPYGNTDQLWASVKVVTDAGTERHVCFLEEALGYDDPIEDAFHLDLGLSLDNTGLKLAGSGCTLTPAAVFGASVTVTAGAAVFAGTSADTGKFIKRRYVDTANFAPDGRDKNGFLRYGEAIAEIVAPISTTQATVKIHAAFPSTAAIPAGEWRLSVTVVTGLAHLNGETVRVVGDGAIQDDKVVAGGQITLETPACTVHVGLGYTGILVPARLDAGSREGTSLARPQNDTRIAINFLRTMGGKIYRRRDDGSVPAVETLGFRKVSDPMDRRVDLFTGWKQTTIAAGWDLDPDITIEQHLPLPMIVRALVPWTDVGRGK